MSVSPGLGAIPFLPTSGLFCICRLGGISLEVVEDFVEWKLGLRDRLMLEEGKFALSILDLDSEGTGLDESRGGGVLGDFWNVFSMDLRVDLSLSGSGEGKARGCCHASSA